MPTERQDALSNHFKECKSVRGAAYTWEVKASFPSLATGMQEAAKQETANPGSYELVATRTS